MKHQFIFICLALALGCCSCSSTNIMTLSVQKPAPIPISPGIKSVAVVDRSKASKEYSTLDAIHKALLLENNELQKEGVQASLEGLTDELMKNNRFTRVVPLTAVQLTSTGAGVFPYPLPWDSVEKICKNSHTDALFSLELFDAGTQVNYPLNPASITTAIRSISSIPTTVNMNTTVRTGWRIYDPSTRTVLDEYVITRNIPTTVSAFSPTQAVSSVAQRKEAIKEVGNQAGQSYADRVLPFWVRVSRDYFVRGNDQFIIARRRAQAGDWNGAAEIWNRETTSANAKIAGRACYNMAIISEINGDLSGAIAWASKSYEDYGIRLALNYLNILKYRDSQNELLKAQDISSGTP
ncbi:MAG: hypothetical protein JST96_07930 [Bacteroidetes bacterium]|nr:hypothetical protein [Bacteroidota bacterium]